MRAEALVLSVALVAAGCAPLTPSRGGRLGYTPRAASESAWVQPPGEESPRGTPSAPLSVADSGEPERRHRRRDLREEVTRVEAGAVGGRRRSGTEAGQAVLEAVDEVKDSMGRAAASLALLAGRPPTRPGNRGLSGANGVFTRDLGHGSNQLPWLRGALGGVVTLAGAAAEVGDADMERGLLRMTGPRLQAALFGAMLLATWLDFLQLADVVLRQCPPCSVEKLLVDLERIRKLMEPTRAALASLEAERVEAAAAAMPGLMGQLGGEFVSIRDGARTVLENHGKIMAAAQLVEMLTLAPALRVALPRLPPAAPMTLGVGLVMGSGGVMVGSRVVVSAEWVERMRQLVQAGVISVPAVSAAVRIHGGQVMMAQAHQELPKGVREALGEGPEVRGMHETGRAGAGMAEPPKHHVLPREHREWFEKRGFTGEMDIDNFCVKLEAAHHQAIHGGGNWRLGRMWPGEWNRMTMKELLDAETRTGRMVTTNEILKIVANRMRRYDIAMNFTAWGGR